MTKEEIIHCADCIYFERFKDRMTNIGYCHSRAPVIVMELMHKTGQFPIVPETYWCGDAELITVEEDKT